MWDGANMFEDMQVEKIKTDRRINPLFIPLIILLGIVPAIMRMKVVDAEDILYEVFRTTQFIDFYSQYKASFIVAITVSMIIMFFVFFRGKKIKTDRITLFYTLSALTFAGLTILSTIFSKYKTTALWGAPDRAEGMVVLCCYIIIFLYTIYSYTSENDYRYILYGLSVIVIINTLLGFTQYIGKDFLLSDLGKRILIPNEYANVREQLTTQFEQGKLTGTLFNPNYIGSFTAMTIPMFGIMTVFVKEKLRRIILFIMTLCSVFLLFGSGSRAGMVALGGIIILAAAIYGKKLWQNKNTVFGIIGLAVLVIGVAGIITKGTILLQIRALVIDATALFMPEDKNFDYRNHIPIRDLFIKDGKVVIETQDDALIIQDTKDGVRFCDKQGNVIKSTLENTFYEFEDERFNMFIFQQFMRVDNPDKVGGLALILNEKVVFLFSLINSEGIELVDPFTQISTEVEYPNTIGFRGKERLGSARGYIWSRSIPMLANTLILGHGPDTFAIKFPQNDYLGKLYAYDHSGIIVDKPHNMYLQIGINQGLLALFVFLTFAVFYIISSFKLYAFRLIYTKSQMIGTAIMLAVAGYLVTGIFNDSAVSVAPIFWILFGSGIAVNYMVSQENRKVE